MNGEEKSCAGCGKAPKWKQDFPIEWEGDHYVTRREMVKFMTLGSAAAGRGELDHRDRRQADASRLDSASATSAPLRLWSRRARCSFAIRPMQDPCIAVRTPEGKLVAYSQVCTHLSCAVVYDKAENALVCPCHKGVFNIDQGSPVAGPPTRPLPRVKIEQRGDRLFATELEA